MVCLVKQYRDMQTLGIYQQEFDIDMGKQCEFQQLETVNLQLQRSDHKDTYHVQRKQNTSRRTADDIILTVSEERPCDQEEFASVTMVSRD